MAEETTMTMKDRALNLALSKGHWMEPWMEQHGIIYARCVSCNGTVELTDHGTFVGPCVEATCPAEMDALLEQAQGIAAYYAEGSEPDDD